MHCSANCVGSVKQLVRHVTTKTIFCTILNGVLMIIMVMMMMLTTKTLICFILNEELMMMRIEDRWNGSILRSQLSTLKVGINL